MAAPLLNLLNTHVLISAARQRVTGMPPAPGSRGPSIGHPAAGSRTGQCITTSEGS